MKISDAEWERIEFEALEARLRQIVDLCESRADRDMIRHITERAMGGLKILMSIRERRRG